MVRCISNEHTAQVAAESVVPICCGGYVMPACCLLQEDLLSAAEYGDMNEVQQCLNEDVDVNCSAEVGWIRKLGLAWAQRS
jgi:hypothetical protein